MQGVRNAREVRAFQTALRLRGKPDGGGAQVVAGLVVYHRSAGACPTVACRKSFPADDGHKLVTDRYFAYQIIV